MSKRGPKGIHVRSPFDKDVFVCQYPNCGFQGVKSNFYRHLRQNPYHRPNLRSPYEYSFPNTSDRSEATTPSDIGNQLDFASTSTMPLDFESTSALPLGPSRSTEYINVLTSFSFQQAWNQRQHYFNPNTTANIHGAAVLNMNPRILTK
ncbi:hypothetical protein HDU76_003812 [Blyttiomyces sp. JEL0837]|nr:hypothetical protein HDU76_003812 [Blyttiomyces sp. JEL0837]